MALRLFAVTHTDDHRAARVPPGVRTIALRDLAAVVSESADEPAHADDATVRSHREVVEGLFTDRTILPAPPGVTFRTPQALQRWMEIHYVALSDALAYIDDRAAARVHIVRADGSGKPAEAGSDLAAAAAECMRLLRRQAVAGLPLRTSHIGPIVLSSAFLVERETWHEFTGAVRRIDDDHPGLHLELTGPWPPYDFVRIEFAG